MLVEGNMWAPHLEADLTDAPDAGALELAGDFPFTFATAVRASEMGVPTSDSLRHRRAQHFLWYRTPPCGWPAF